MQRNIFAYTAPTPAEGYPEYISLNERDDCIVLTARSRGAQGATIDVPLDRKQLKALYAALRQELSADNGPKEDDPNAHITTSTRG